MIPADQSAPSISGEAQLPPSMGGRMRDSIARLEKLPESLEFPAALRHRILFDPALRRLVFRGFMSKADYDRLRLLSTDVSYLRALEQLFQESSECLIHRRAVHFAFRDRRRRHWAQRIPLAFWCSALIGACLGGIGLFWWLWQHRI